MAQLSLGEGKWRMLRRALKKKAFRYADCRNMTRHDQDHFDWLVENGFFAQVGDGAYETTETGRAAADLGLYEWERAPEVPPVPVTRRPKTARLGQTGRHAARSASPIAARVSGFDTTAAPSPARSAAG
jgi:hypothetical protein